MKTGTGMAVPSRSSNASAAIIEELKKDKEHKRNDIRQKTTEKNEKERTIQELKNDLDGNQTDLVASKNTLEQISKECIAQCPSYEEHRAVLNAEIKSLQKAMRILNKDDLA